MWAQSIPPLNHLQVNSSNQVIIKERSPQYIGYTDYSQLTALLELSQNESETTRPQHTSSPYPDIVPGGSLFWVPMETSKQNQSLLSRSHSAVTQSPHHYYHTSAVKEKGSSKHKLSRQLQVSEHHKSLDCARDTFVRGTQGTSIEEKVLSKTGEEEKRAGTRGQLVKRHTWASSADLTGQVCTRVSF